MAMIMGSKQGPATWKKLLVAMGIILLTGVIWSDGGLHADEGGALVLPGPDEKGAAVEAMRLVEWNPTAGILQVMRPTPDRLSELVVLTGVVCSADEACSLFERGEFDRLVNHYRGLTKSGKEDAVTRRGLALNLYLSGDLHGALRAYSWAANESPTDPHVRIGMASVLSELGLLEQARRELDPLLGDARMAAAAWVGLGNAQRSKGGEKESLGSYDRAIGLSPQLAAAHFNRGLSLMDEEQPAKAAEAFRATGRQLTRFSDAFLLEGLTRLRSKDSIGAAVALYRAEDLGNESSALYLALGVACREQNLDGLAAKYLKRALESGVRDERIHQLLAASLMRLGRSEEAAEALEEGFALQPKTADTHFLQGLKLFLVEQPERSAEHMLESIRMGKRDADVFFVLGQALLQTGQSEAAIRSLQVAAKMRPSSPEIRFSLGMALAKGDDGRGAVREMKTAAGLDPKDLAIARGLMDAYEQVGDFAACAAQGRRIVDRWPEVLSVRFETSFCLALQGDLDAASTHLEAALDQDLEGDAIHDLWRKLQILSESDSGHHMPGVHLLLAIIHQQRGNWSAATQAYEHFLLSHPDARWTRRALKRIHSLAPRR